MFTASNINYPPLVASVIAVLSIDTGDGGVVAMYPWRDGLYRPTERICYSFYRQVGKKL